MIGRLNPVIRGQANYHRTGASKHAYAVLDNHLWWLTYQWARRQHRQERPEMGRTRRYFGRFNKARGDKWVFGDRASGAYLHKYSWTPIVRHVMVAGRASPDDPALARYWADRRRSAATPPRRPNPGSGRCAPKKDGARTAGGGSSTPTAIRTPPARGSLVRAVRTALTLQASAAPGGGRTPTPPRTHPLRTPPPGRPHGGTDTSTRRACPPTRAA